jgi:cell division protein ZapA (FtsZ GTPase activity inhibitor)
MNLWGWGWFCHRKEAATKVSEAEALNWIIRRIDRIEDKLNRILEGEKIIMAAVNEALDDLEAQTAAIDGAEDSAEAAFTRLADMIQSLKDNQTDPATATRIQAAADELRARAAKLAAAVDASPQS